MLTGEGGFLEDDVARIGCRQAKARVAALYHDLCQGSRGASAGGGNVAKVLVAMAGAMGLSTLPVTAGVVGA